MLACPALRIHGFPCTYIHTSMHENILPQPSLSIVARYCAPGLCVCIYTYIYNWNRAAARCERVIKSNVISRLSSAARVKRFYRRPIESPSDKRMYLLYMLVRSCEKILQSKTHGLCICMCVFAYIYILQDLARERGAFFLGFAFADFKSACKCRLALNNYFVHLNERSPSVYLN